MDVSPSRQHGPNLSMLYTYTICKVSQIQNLTVASPVICLNPGTYLKNHMMRFSMA